MIHHLVRSIMVSFILFQLVFSEEVKKKENFCMACSCGYSLNDNCNSENSCFRGMYEYTRIGKVYYYYKLVL